jgi:hypothetical protein
MSLFGKGVDDEVETRISLSNYKRGADIIFKIQLLLRLLGEFG